MNNPDDIPLNADELIGWMRAYRDQHSLSWSMLARETDMPPSTIQAVVSGTYKGNLDMQLKRIFRFKQKVESQRIRTRSALAAPTFFQTPTARRLLFLLETAQMGRMVVAATGPGTGKSMAARHYRDSMTPVWFVTAQKSTNSVAAMINKVMGAMAIHASGWAQHKSGRVAAHVEGRGGLLIIDEAGNLPLDALEEIRGWHDEAGLGVALFGNQELWLRIEGAADRHGYARLKSRIAQCHIQDLPVERDAEVYLDGMEIEDGESRRLLVNIAISPAHGGLREVQQILETAKMLAIGDDTAVAHEHIVQARASRMTSQLRRAA